MLEILSSYLTKSGVIINNSYFFSDRFCLSYLSLFLTSSKLVKNRATNPSIFFKESSISAGFWKNSRQNATKPSAT